MPRRRAPCCWLLLCVSMCPCVFLHVICHVVALCQPMSTCHVMYVMSMCPPCVSLCALCAPVSVSVYVPLSVSMHASMLYVMSCTSCRSMPGALRTWTCYGHVGRESSLKLIQDLRGHNSRSQSQSQVTRRRTSPCLVSQPHMTLCA